MSLISNLSVRLQNHPKRVVFPEGTDSRIIQAARQFATRRLGVPILVGDRTRIKINATRLGIKLDGIRIIEPARAAELEEYTRLFRGMQRFNSLNEVEAADYVLSPNYFASMMVLTGAADAMVCGATQVPTNALRAIFQLFPRQKGVETISSMQIMEMEESRFGLEGTIFMSDCAVIPNPTAEQLADIAITTAILCHHLTNEAPRVAMLSYTSKSISSRFESVEKVRTATALAKEKARNFDVPVEIDGELQVDAALDPFAAEIKELKGPVAGCANVLVFPDLNSGNIASKLTQLVADVPVYGPILTGLAKPVAEISRGASARDILGAAIVVAAQAVDRRYLYPVDA
ncbi:MAG: phosphate acetyltransferase [Opitutae bacterium]|nr:phosphate acetyltransferase [Opitutae bacterium]MCD8298312.1 phosphate acetyltransferase [Opitutae bacterium]